MDDFKSESTLTLDELSILDKAKASNKWWFMAVLDAATIQASRKAKYSGDDDPYFNFMDVAAEVGRPVEDTFRFYLAIKWSRMKKTVVDFADERFVDTLLDLANYALLFIGWLKRKEAKEHETN